MPEQSGKTEDQAPRRPSLDSYGDHVTVAEQLIANNGWS